MALKDLKKTRAGFSTPFAGTIRLGEKIKKEIKGRVKEIPSNPDTFVVRGDTEGEKAVIEAYGERPSELTIFFPPFNSNLRESDFDTKEEYKSAFVSEWTDKVMTVRYVAYSSAGKGSNGGSLMLIGDDKGCTIKNSDFYKRLLGKKPEGEMPSGGWKITLGEGETWDDHEKFQELLKDGTIKVTATMSFWIKDITSSGVFRIVTSSVSIISGFYQYIDSITSSGMAPFMVATKIKKKKITVNRNGTKMTPGIISFEQYDNWAELGIEHIETIKRKREPVQKLISSMYGTKEIMNLGSASNTTEEVAAIESKVSTYTTEIVADEINDEHIAADYVEEDQDVEEFIEDGVLELDDDAGVVLAHEVKQCVETSESEVVKEEKEKKKEDMSIYTKAYLATHANNLGVGMDVVRDIVAKTKKDENIPEEEYIKKICDAVSEASK